MSRFKRYGGIILKNILVVNACINRETSRTNRLCSEFVKVLQNGTHYADVNEIMLEDENLQPLNSNTLAKRLELINKSELSDEVFRFANQLINADCIIIAAPYWDLGFPAMLKNYIENVSIAGLTYKYNEQGRPIGQCKAECIYYVTTCGGYIRNLNLGFDTIKALSTLFGIPQCKCIAAEGLDIQTNNVEEIMNNVIAKLPESI